MVPYAIAGAEDVRGADGGKKLPTTIWLVTCPSSGAEGATSNGARWARTLFQALLGSLLHQKGRILDLEVGAGERDHAMSANVYKIIHCSVAHGRRADADGWIRRHRRCLRSGTSDKVNHRSQHQFD